MGFRGFGKGRGDDDGREERPARGIEPEKDGRDAVEAAPVAPPEPPARPGPFDSEADAPPPPPAGSSPSTPTQAAQPSKPPPSTHAARQTEAAVRVSESVAPQREQAPAQLKHEPAAEPESAVDVVAHTVIDPRGYVRLRDGELVPAWWVGRPGDGPKPGEGLVVIEPSIRSELPQAAIDELRNDRAIAVIRPGDPTPGRTRSGLIEGTRNRRETNS